MMNINLDEQKNEENLEGGDNWITIPSSVVKITVLSDDKSLPAQRRFKVEQRDKETQKVSLAPYREESKKIFEIIQTFAKIVEKASCDEAFIDVTEEVNQMYEASQNQSQSQVLIS